MRKAKRKKRKKERPNGRTEKEERKVGEKRERERVKSCDWWVPWCSVIYGNAIENRVMETKNS